MRTIFVMAFASFGTALLLRAAFALLGASPAQASWFALSWMLVAVLAASALLGGRRGLAAPGDATAERRRRAGIGAARAARIRLAIQDLRRIAECERAPSSPDLVVIARLLDDCATSAVELRPPTLRLLSAILRSVALHANTPNLVFTGAPLVQGPEPPGASTARPLSPLGGEIGRHG